MHARTGIVVFITLLTLLLGGGCQRNDAIAFQGEDSDPNYERGKSLIRQGRSQEALSYFLKVISKRGDEAPESHLEAGLIYEAHIKDYLAAIYHFRKYIELQPNSRQADLVAKRIESSKREFARTLPAHPLEDQSVKLGFMDQLDILRRENEQLKAELSALRAGISSVPASSYRGGFDIPFQAAPAVEQEPEAQATDDSPISHAPLVVESPKPSLRPLPEPPTRPATSAGTAQQAGGRKHVIGRGDTLYSLANKYYGNRSRWRDIYQANKDQLKSEQDTLRLGMELKIP